MRVLNGRDWWLPPGKIPGLTRFAVFGDSFVFGQGVAPDQTLPFFLEQQLNETWPAAVFQVANCGVSGFNIYNSLSVIRDVPPFYDGVILILCLNDTQIFERTFKVSYPPVAPSLWEPGTPTHELMVNALANVNAWLTERGIPFALGYYSIWDIDYEARTGTILSELCRALHIPFANFFDYFRDRRLRSNELRATKYDLHPSAIAHGAAARHLAGILQKAGWIKSLRTSAAPEIMPKEIMRIADAMSGEGAAHDAVLRWGLDGLTAKKRGVARLPDEGVRNAFADAAKDAANTLSGAYAAWRVRVRAQALVHFLFMRESSAPGHVWLSDESILRAEELLMTAAMSDPSAAAQLTAQLPGQSPTPDTSNWSSAASAVHAALAKIARFRKMMAEADAIGAWMPSVPGHPPATHSSFSRLLNFVTVLERQAATWQQRACEIDTMAGTIPNGVSHLLSLARECMTEGALHLSASCDHYDYLLEDLPPAPEFLTSVDVYVKTFNHPSEPPIIIDVFIDSIAPRRMTMKDGMYIGLDGSNALMSLRFPVFFFGRPSISVHTPRPDFRGRRGTLTKVEIYNNPDRRVSLGPDDFHQDKSGDLVFPLVLVP
jgi:lysophospholipase L1-like esterase